MKEGCLLQRNIPLKKLSIFLKKKNLDRDKRSLLFHF
jgi:hypothetical protein